jgi:hypothetical protein
MSKRPKPSDLFVKPSPMVDGFYIVLLYLYVIAILGFVAWVVLT